MTQGSHMESAAIALHDVSVAYDHSRVLSQITLGIETGEFVGVVGPNGAGKTTLLNALLGLVPLARGTIQLHGRPIAEARRNIAYMPQREVVDWTFPVTVEDVVMMGRQARIGWMRRPTQQDHKVVDRAIEKVQMSDLQCSPIGELSGGQQQRVFLARALAQEGDLLLLDEPLTGVDATTQETILKLLQNYRSERRTVLMTTHDLGSARLVCSKLLFLNRVLMAYGTPTETFIPEVLEKTYGGHILRVSAESTAAPMEETLMIVGDDAHHFEGKGPGDKRG